MKEPTFAGGPSIRHMESTLTGPDQKQIGSLDQLSVKSVSGEIYTFLLLINDLFLPCGADPRRALQLGLVRAGSV